MYIKFVNKFEKELLPEGAPDEKLADKFLNLFLALAFACNKTERYEEANNFYLKAKNLFLKRTEKFREKH